MATQIAPLARGHRVLRVGRWCLLVAITIGAFLGAMSCAAGMALGGGHSVHAAAVGAPAGHIDGPHAHHPSPASVDDAPSSMRSDDGSPAGPARGGETHPGTACVTSVQLRVPDLIVPAEARSAVRGSTMPPADRATEPEPPVPRHS